MSDTPPVPEPPAPLTDAAREEVGRIADWCEGQRDHAEKMAGAQIRVVWILLLGGLVLLLVLPRLLLEIDFVWQKDSLPPTVLESFEDTEQQIEGNRIEMEQERRTAEDGALRARKQVAAAAGEMADLENSLQELLIRPYGMWRVHTESLNVRDMAEPRPDFVVVAGIDARPEPTRALTPETMAVLLVRERRGEWVSARPVANNEELSDIVAVVPDRRDQYLLAGRIDGRSVILGPGAVDWRILWEGEPGGGQHVQDLEVMGDGSVVAVGGGVALLGSEVTPLRTSPALALRSLDRDSWQPLAVRDGEAAPLGWLSHVARFGTGAVVAGIVQDENRFVPAFLYSFDFENWREVTGDDVQSLGTTSLRSLANQDDGTIFAAGSQGAILRLELDAEPVEVDIVEQSGTDNTLVRLDAGLILLLGHLPGEAPRSEIAVLGGRAAPIKLERAGQPADLPFRTGLSLGPERVLAGGDGFLIESLETEAREAMVARIMSGDPIPDDLIVPSAAGAIGSYRSTAEAQRNLGELRVRLGSMRESLNAREAVLRAASLTLERQERVKADFAAISDELTQALRAAEPARQLAQIATRLAVIGLLIYLVQIVVNRYRYLQRLAGFYQARAQAFRLLAASPDAALLRGVSLADVTATLSPDGIGFDKAAEPPTGQMVSLLQAGLRKS